MKCSYLNTLLAALFLALFPHRVVATDLDLLLNDSYRQNSAVFISVLESSIAHEVWLGGSSHAHDRLIKQITDISDLLNQLGFVSVDNRPTISVQVSLQAMSELPSSIIMYRGVVAACYIANGYYKPRRVTESDLVSQAEECARNRLSEQTTDIVRQAYQAVIETSDLQIYHSWARDNLRHLSQ